MSALFLVLVTIIVILLLIYTVSTWKYGYWKKKNVPHLKPTPIFGNYKDYITLKKIAAEVAHDICSQFPDEPYIGTYYGTEPALLVQDPELIKLITTKDYPYFSGREISIHTDKEIATRSMFFTFGDRWKVLRQNMSPLFTGLKVKGMFPLIIKCTHAFEDMLEREASISDEMEVRSIMSRFMMECIGSCGFGVDTNVMAKEVNENVFRKIGDVMFEVSNIRGLALICRSMWPALFYGVGFQVFPKSMSDFFHHLVTGVFKSRSYKPSSRNDFVDLLLNLRQNDYLSSESMIKSTKGQKVILKVDDELLVAQCGLFFSAGYETSATTSSFVLYELAKHQEIQKRAAEEVDAYLRRTEGKIGYECVTDLPFLEACIDEALRLRPVLGLLTREVMETYSLPSGLTLEKGTRVHLPIYHMHHNPKYFPDPESFKPERFLAENKANITPYTYMPFGEGQRICLGMRVAKMQMIPGLITVLRKFRVELAPGMPREVKLEPRGFVTAPTIGLRLKFIKR